MATTYLAPGVYVEEVPSAQQPIAGVGTSTAGFIGIVPDEIQYPVPNDEYDPQLAAAAAAAPAERDQERRTIEEEMRGLERRRTQVQGALDQLQQQISQLPADADPATRQRLTTQLQQREQERDQVARDIEARRQRLGQPAAVEERFLKPYTLQTFQVTVEPFDTKLCTNFSEYTSRFGSYSADDPNTPGQALHPGHRALTHAVYGFFQNGGTRCFVARVRSDNGADIDRALAAFESIDAVAIVAAPGLHGQDIWTRLVTHCETCEDRFAVLDCPPTVEKSDGELDETKLTYDTPDNALPQRNRNAAFYFPYIEVVDPAKQMQDQDPARGVPTKYWGRVYIPPSGHVAGVYARTDEERGVHKAPANSAILGALNVKYYISKSRQGLLNPQGVNCIRNMNGNITIWGARTVGGDKNGEWKYVNVRRLFLFLRESIDEGTQWVVFEPNDPTLWGKIRRNVGAFLTNVWRSGALFGLTPEEAFYVKCDAETNPPEVRELGMVVTEIGVAIVRPAEFVIFRVTQSIGPRTT
jgi:phage tail sheath protein FI